MVLFIGFEQCVQNPCRKGMLLKLSWSYKIFQSGVQFDMVLPFSENIMPYIIYASYIYKHIIIIIYFLPTNNLHFTVGLARR